MKIKIASSILIFVASVTFAFAQTTSEEKLTITTYYPSPMGIYNQLQAKRIVIGDVNGDGILNSADIPANVRPLYVQNASGGLATAAFANQNGYGVGIGAADASTVGIIQSHLFLNGVGTSPIGANLSINPNGGNVGIGTTNPQQTLEVNGSIRLEPLSTAPVALEGSLYYNSTSKQVLVANATQFNSMCPRIQSERRSITNPGAHRTYNIVFPKANYFSQVPVVIVNVDCSDGSGQWLNLGAAWGSSFPLHSSWFYISSRTVNGFTLDIYQDGVAYTNWYISYIATES